MNDFAIQGVTILGTEISNHGFALLSFILFALLSLSFLGLVCMGIFDKEYLTAVVCSLLCVLSIFATFTFYKEWKTPPEIIYTVSIDDTARYNEIKNNFYSVKKLQNGLYEVKINKK